MAIKVRVSTDPVLFSTVIDDNKRGKFKALFPGQFAEGSQPASPKTGDIIWNTTSSALQVYDGSTWSTI